MPPAGSVGRSNPISTNVSGIQIFEHMPRLAKIMDKVTILRSIVRSDDYYSPNICDPQ
jgi:hypothetical protein